MSRNTPSPEWSSPTEHQSILNFQTGEERENMSPWTEEELKSCGEIAKMWNEALEPPTPTKAGTGCSLSLETCLKCQKKWTPGCSLCAVNWNKGSEDLSIGKSLSPLKRKLDFEESPTSSDMSMPSSQGRQPRIRTSGKKTLESQELNLNWEPVVFDF